jgi:hypothetical protein
MLTRMRMYMHHRDLPLIFHPSQSVYIQRHIGDGHGSGDLYGSCHVSHTSYSCEHEEYVPNLGD